MATTESKGRSHPAGPDGHELRRRLVIDAGVLVFLLGLALVFVVAAPT